MLPILQLATLSQAKKKEILQRKLASTPEIKTTVAKILTEIEQKGLAAVLQFTHKFETTKVRKLEIPAVEFPQVDLSKFQFLTKTAKNLAKFARVQLRNLRREPKVRPQAGLKIWREFRPLQKVGIYAPGGLASYPSSILMQAIPARIAGVKEIVLATPPQKDGTIPAVIWAAAQIAGVTKVWTCGGAQAIGALAYLEQVDKITGPGNPWVTTAKTLISQQIAIDFVAGPSEILILADEKSQPKFLAADLIAQAEHAPDSPTVLITTSAKLAQKVQQELQEQLEGLPRAAIARASLKNLGVILLAENLTQMVNFANEYAPEHLEIMLANPAEILPKIQNAGSIFLGEFTPTAVGDFISGTNHVLPTMGFARSQEALSVETFGKKIQVQLLSKNGLKKVQGVCKKFAEIEGLVGHGRSVGIRLAK